MPAARPQRESPPQRTRPQPGAPVAFSRPHHVTNLQISKSFCPHLAIDLFSKRRNKQNKKSESPGQAPIGLLTRAEMDGTNRTDDYGFLTIKSNFEHPNHEHTAIAAVAGRTPCSGPN